MRPPGSKRPRRRHCVWFPDRSPIVTRHSDKPLAGEPRGVQHAHKPSDIPTVGIPTYCTRSTYQVPTLPVRFTSSRILAVFVCEHLLTLPSPLPLHPVPPLGPLVRGRQSRGPARPRSLCQPSTRVLEAALGLHPGAVQLQSQCGAAAAAVWAPLLVRFGTRRWRASSGPLHTSSGRSGKRPRRAAVPLAMRHRLRRMR